MDAIKMRAYLLVMSLSLCVAVGELSAQQSSDPQIFTGNTVLQEEDFGNSGAQIYLQVGSPVHFGNTQISPAGDSVRLQFPWDILYTPLTFDANFFVSKGYFSDVVELQWDVIANSDDIDRFLIYRKALDSPSDSTLIGSIPSDIYNFTDETVQQGTIYKYTVYATGISSDFVLPLVNVIEETGFAFPSGTALGRIAFEGGTAVEGVTVIAETDGDLRGRSISFDGLSQFLSVPHLSDHDELFIEKGFTIQLWMRYDGNGQVSTLFSKGSLYNLAYDGAEITFDINGTSATLAYQNPVDSFFHIAARLDVTNQLISITAASNERTKQTISVGITNLPASTNETILFGRDQSGNFFEGWMDEIRLWGVALSEETVDSNFDRFISGQEDDLIGYWKLDAGVGDDIYDFSQPSPGDFNENHGTVQGADFSDITPLKSQLAFKGVTDASGNYIITGFPYATAGSLYRFTPIFGTHAFDPAERIRFVGPGESIHNDVDFTDISSFPVSGTVRYSNTGFPVEDVSILIDGISAVDSENELIVTDNLGRFTVDVPIGNHSIRMSKSQHVFEKGGRFPEPTAMDDAPTFDFQEPLAGLEFFDSTLVRFTGRVVGGPRESDKLLGFGLSTDNIGDATIEISSEKGFPLVIQSGDSTTLSAEPNINSEVIFNGGQLTINADTETGEFVTYLPPEKYAVTGVRSAEYTFPDTYNISLDLTTFFEQEEVLQDTLLAEVNEVAIPGYVPFDPNDYDEITEVTRQDTVYTIGTAIYRFDKRNDFILRNTPSISVLNTLGGELFGERTFLYTDDVREEEITLIDENDDYTFGLPVFEQRKNYSMRVSVFEAYTNGIDIDEVPVSDGTVEIMNNLANDREALLSLDSRGRANYTFTAGFPELNKSAVDAAEDFTKTLSLTVVTGENGAFRTTWPETGSFRGYVFGGVAQGNSFVTNGPNQITTILRDPPGSNSSASLERGSTIERTTSWSVGNETSGSVETAISLGADVITFAGVGAGAIFEIKTANTTDIGLEFESSYSEEGENTTTVSNTQVWSTSDDPSFVGSQGDVFVGYSTNLVYGAAISLQPLPVASEECVDGDCTTSDVGGFTIGKRIGLRINPEFNTGFIYTQSFIENELLPSLGAIRNSFLTYTGNDTEIVTGSDPVYLSLVSPDDLRYGSANNDQQTWGNAATAFIGMGPSYKILLPAGFDPDQVSDTVGYYNKQIISWANLLAENEQQKLEADLIENLSFDAGVSLEKSTTVEFSQTSSKTFTWSLGATLATTLGLEVSGVGLETTISAASSGNSTDGTAEASTNSTTYTYSLADGESNGSGDFYSIDVKQPKDGFGPVFSTRAGATSCPFEGEETTRYFESEKNHVLHFATLQVEDPGLTILNPVVANVPSNREAEITIELSNNTQTEDDIFYTLSQNDLTNPSGAVISIDGAVLEGVGRGFLVPAGQSVTKIVKVAKGTDDVDDYEDIELILSSQCDDNISVSQTFSVFFQPGCSDIELITPQDQFVINTNTRPVNTMTVSFGSYDLRNSQFDFAAFQYKATSSSTWITDRLFYNRRNISNTAYEALDEPKASLEASGTTSYLWDMSALPDRTYDIRVITSCDIGTSDLAITPTAIHSGRKDTTRPEAFGAPQPGDGILSTGDELRVKFTEDIEAGLLTPFNFSVRGVFNNVPLDHSASVQFDGTSDHVRIEDGLSLASTDFTVFFWVRREAFGQEYVLFSKGPAAEDLFEVGFNSSNQMYVEVSGTRYSSSTAFPTTGQSAWEYYGVVYEEATHSVTAYRNGEFVLEDVALTSSFTGDGPISIGKSALGEMGYFEGNMHELRIWKDVLQQGRLVADKDISLSGSEVDLVGYWPMDEARGDLAFDKARSRHARVEADWQVDPQGYALALDGVDDYIEINTGSTVTIDDRADMTIEFWFNATSGQTGTVLFSNGLADGTDEFNRAEDAWNIGINDIGQVYAMNNGYQLILEGSETAIDNQWHHLAVALNRTGNTNVFLDGELAASAPAINYGGLTGSDMWIGARVNRTGTVSTQASSHFEGIIDEFRIWNTTRSADQLALDLNSALVGDELGLAAYYPFESYAINAGVPVRTSSLEDQLDDTEDANGGLATTVGGPGLVQNTATIKIARAVQDIDFDWVVNGDELIITTASSFDPLTQGTVIELGLSGVEDLYQNRISSPITWTAFIDLNQLQWEEDRFDITKDVNEAYSFTTEIVNSGGTQRSFQMTNLPPWLTASPSTGTLEPDTRLSITFTINEGLNIGYYNEDIYLSTDEGFVEKLQLDLAVVGEAPDWQVNPFDFQYSMNMIASLSVNDVESRDSFDIIAVFADDEVRGVTQLTYIPELDRYIAFLDIYSNEQTGEEIELRVWDTSQGFEYRGVQPELTFISNQIIGQPFEPEVIRAGETILQSVAVRPGWNWLSFNLQSAQLDKVSDLLENLNPERGDHIKSQTAVDIFTDELGWLGTLSSGGGVEVGELYQLLSSNPGIIELKGTRVSPSDIKIPIVEGWNFIGFTPLFNLTVAEAFANFEPSNGDVVKSQFAFAIYYEGPGWVGSLTTLEPDRGYLYLSGKEGELSFPNTTVLNGRKANENVITEWNGQLDRYEYPNNMAVIGQLDSALSDADAYILGYVGDELRSVAEPVLLGDKHYYFLTIYGETSDESLEFRLGNPETGTQVSLSTTLAFDAKLVHGTLDSPVIFRAEGPPILRKINIYPNPFKSEGISIELPELNGEIELSLLTLTGQLLKRVNLPVSQEARKFDWQLRSLNPGVYLVAVRNEQQVFVQRIIKQ